jgi:hypothetical protein
VTRVENQHPLVIGVLATVSMAGAAWAAPQRDLALQKELVPALSQA